MKMNPGKKAAVLGLGVSGSQSALFLKKKGFDVFASDAGASPVLSQRVKELESAGIQAEVGKHTLEKILACDWVLISPGIPPSAEAYRAVKAKGLPVFSEIEVASWFCPSSKITAVTGSSGKTTVTTLISRVLQKTYGRVFLCGNIGNPWIGELDKIRPEDHVVIEVSSFQLAHCESFRPQVGVLLNLSPNHQDWHPDMKDYAAAKLRIFKNQGPSDFAVFREKDRKAYFPEFEFKAGIRLFDAVSGGNPNEEVVCLVSSLHGCSEPVINEVIHSFEGIEHRLEKTAFANGVTYVNDSKCTTTASLAWALEKFPDGKVLLLAGGHPKSDDFNSIRGLIQRKVKKAFLIGEAIPLLQTAWQGACPMVETSSFESAVTEAHALAEAGDVVLLSPACASFDMFKNYQERGTLFKKLALMLTGKSGAGSLNHV